MSEPLRREASTTTTPEDIPAMIRFLTGKLLDCGSVPGRKLGEEQIPRPHRLLQRGVLARVIDIEAAAEHRDRPSRRAQRRLVRALVHAAREARNDRDPGGGELAREARRHVPPIARRRPRPDDADGRQAQAFEVAGGEEQEGGIGDLGERIGILLVESGHDADSRALELRDPFFGRNVLRRAQHGKGFRPRFQPLRQLLFRRRQEGLDPAQGPQDRPETLRRQLAPARPGDRRPAQNWVPAHGLLKLSFHS